MNKAKDYLLINAFTDFYLLKLLTTLNYTVAK